MLSSTDRKVTVCRTTAGENVGLSGQTLIGLGAAAITSSGER